MTELSRRSQRCVRAPVRTVLLVDDDEQVLTLFDKWMTRLGMHVATCRTFEEAVRYLSSIVPDVLVTDVRLGGENGLGLAVRTQARHPAVSIVVLTGFDDPVLRRDAHSLKAQFLVKPIGRGELIAAVTGEKPQATSHGRTS